nr:hypothetical protein [Tanacetum cinerariifolium]
SKEQIKEEESRAIAKEAESIKQHLQIVPDEDDDVDDTHQLYASFITMLKNFDREDLETLWRIVKERFSTSKPNNFSDEYLLTALKMMFERPYG